MKLEVDNIELSFNQKKVLSGIYLRANKGEITGILGRNGCGKSCLLEILFGTLKPKYKTIRIDSLIVKKQLFLSKDVAYLPQYSLLPKNLKIHTIFSLLEQKWDTFIMDFPTFKNYKFSNLSKLSTGEIRVLEAYLILNSKQKIILLDEPFSFIAPIYVEKFKNLIVKKKEGKTILITDHFYKEILEICDRLYLIKNGYSKEVKNHQDLVNEGYLLSNQ